MKRPTITFSGVTFRYPEQYGEGGNAIQVDGLSFEEGGRYAITGSCGSGKTTLVLLLKGLLMPATGRLELTDSSDTLLAFRRKTGICFQFPEEQFFRETVAEEVAYGPEVLGMQDIGRRVEEGLALVGLPYRDFSHLSPFELSSGQKRRLALASVIACDPSWFIFDEPTAGLDPEGKRLVLELIERLSSEGRTLLIITQELGAFALLCDEIIAMEQGKILLKMDTETFLDTDRSKSVFNSLPYHIQVLKTLRGQGWHLPVTLLNPSEAASLIAKQLP